MAHTLDTFVAGIQDLWRGQQQRAIAGQVALIHACNLCSCSELCCKRSHDPSKLVTALALANHRVAVDYLIITIKGTLLVHHQSNALCLCDRSTPCATGPSRLPPFNFSLFHSQTSVSNVGQQLGLQGMLYLAEAFCPSVSVGCIILLYLSWPFLRC